MDPVTALVIGVSMLVLSYALAPKPPSAKPASMKDLDIPVAEQGKPIPVVFGTVTVKGLNVVWYGNMSTKKIKTSSGK